MAPGHAHARPMGGNLKIFLLKGKNLLLGHIFQMPVVHTGYM
jgi:hypothetical protein